MAWSYDPTTLSSSSKDQVRFKLGDTVEEEALLQDEEIEFLLAQNNGSVIQATIAACMSIISILSGVTDFRIGPYSESQGNRLKAYQALYQTLLAQASRLNSPIAKDPTTTSVFHYDMMVIGSEDHE